MSNLLVVDIDHDDALLRTMWDRDGWRPNAVVENPANGHAHAVWALAAPFCPNRIRPPCLKRTPGKTRRAALKSTVRSLPPDVPDQSNSGSPQRSVDSS
ncbi:replication initiation protein [Corynebacterium endometrii]|uniref:replication initiation protein n=1 Tax=Corynebacterium endometrii TaxID=2488819 RepID=UPI001FE311E5|nr:replication initiation protein [Corynebacterium endometrii]